MEGLAEALHPHQSREISSHAELTNQEVHGIIISRRQCMLQCARLGVEKTALKVNKTHSGDAVLCKRGRLTCRTLGEFWVNFGSLAARFPWRRLVLSCCPVSDNLCVSTAPGLCSRKEFDDLRNDDSSSESLQRALTVDHISQ